MYNKEILGVHVLEFVINMKACCEYKKLLCTSTSLAAETVTAQSLSQVMDNRGIVVRFPVSKEISHFFIAPGRSLSPTQPAVQCVPTVLSRKV